MASAGLDGKRTHPAGQSALAETAQSLGITALSAIGRALGRQQGTARRQHTLHGNSLESDEEESMVNGGVVDFPAGPTAACLSRLWRKGACSAGGGRSAT